MEAPFKRGDVLEYVATTCANGAIVVVEEVRWGAEGCVTWGVQVTFIHIPPELLAFCRENQWSVDCLWACELFEKIGELPDGCVPER